MSFNGERGGGTELTNVARVVRFGAFPDAAYRANVLFVEADLVALHDYCRAPKADLERRRMTRAVFVVVRVLDQLESEM